MILLLARREVTLRASGPLLMNQLYLSRRPLWLPGWRKITIALLEPGRSTSITQLMPSGDCQTLMMMAVQVVSRPARGTVVVARRSRRSLRARTGPRALRAANRAAPFARRSRSGNLSTRAADP